ncbi:hypothetical protein L6164_008862 [Bauhinia variegata]|uniref:Uncharacterized protein n=1 Tax=Bauhinia variegata TaxID=167791 RepID=A0ACB9PI13_BAUVA|nr:hypothetical protein L6164_008862 [Bauhinia variegata]
MAEALLEVVLRNLNSLILKDLASFWHVDKEIEKLSSTLTTIRTVLEDAEEKQTTNHALKVWLQKLKDATCVLDDIMDLCSIKSSQLGYEGKNLTPSNQVNSCSLTSLNPKNMVFRYKVGRKMKEIRERLDQIAEERQRFHLREGNIERRSEVVESRETSSIITQPQIYGRDGDREKIVELLLRHASDSDDLSIYSIVGIGGVGKTTIAQLVFNDERVSKHFDLLIWVCVSENFSVKGILLSIIESILKQRCKTLDLDPIQKQVQELLQSKKYLLVLDDVWNEDQEKWDKLKYVLSCGSKGASILVTTRLRKVASIMGTIPTHHLSSLSEVDCWLLLKQRAFGHDREERPELMAIGKEIVKKCGGLPLAAKALGGLLRFKSEEQEWLHVKDSEIWNLPADENCVLPALKLSYINLPLKLRQCFVFCAIFPKDKAIKKEVLIHLWMANGFISSRGNLAMEDVGSQIWNELYQRSFFQDIKTNKFGQVENFKMHDLVHDLTCSIMGEECLVLEDASSTNLSRSTHHISCSYSNQPFDLGGLRNVESLRTLILEPYKGCIHFEFSTFHSTTIRALRVGGTSSISLKNFIHLRYLDISYSQIEILPESIYSLQKLQTLKLEGCSKLLRLPKHLMRLKDLRHLCIKGCNSLSQMPPKIGELTCLKSLSTFIVGSKEEYCLSEIRDLELAGELHIKGLENTASALDARDANLIGKKDLHHLHLSWDWNVVKELHTSDAQQVLEALQPHSNLKSLTIEGYVGVQFPNWMTTLSTLLFLELGICINCLQLPPLGKLPSLRSLKIGGMKYVQYIDSESYDSVAQKAFMSLETLEVGMLPNLESFLKEENKDMFPCLSKLSIYGCPRLRLPTLPSIKHLVISPCREELLWSISNHRNLTSLKLCACVDLTYFPEGMLRNLSCLKTLTMLSFIQLKVLPIELFSLVALERLLIVSCPELESFPEKILEGLCSLRVLRIKNCEKLGSLSGVQHLTLLEHLEISSCPNLLALPSGMNHLSHLLTVTIKGCFSNCRVLQGIEHVPCLRSLNLHHFHEVASLPESLGELTTLQRLSIFDCPNLTTLPTSFQNLTSLHKVDIACCPELQKQCKEETWDIVRAWSHFMTRFESGGRVEWKRKG